MDSRSLEKIIKKREHNYIWLEKKLKKIIVLIVSVMLTLFVVLSLLWKLNNLNGYVLFGTFIAGTFVISGGAYKWYKSMFWDFEQISKHLEQYENGNFTFRAEGIYGREGLQPQIMEQLQRIGFAFEVMKNSMIDEKENTKALITDISHQLKTPLAALKLIHELYKEEQMTAEEKKEFMEHGECEIIKLQSLMDSMTNLSRMEAGMIQIEPLEGDIIHTLTRAVSSVYMKAFQKNIEIELEESAESMERKNREIIHDSKWTEEAFVNLLDNAIKYSEENTTIFIRVTPKVSYVVISIADQGKGIGREEYSEIFRRFYRGTNVKDMEVDGAGVGLYLVRRILERQGGNVRVKSEMGKGSVFEVMLPKKVYTV